MKIQYASDLHLEFAENSRYLKENPLVPTGDVLVLAGDVGILNTATYTTHPFWDWAAENFKHTLIVPGNHEFYRSVDLAQMPHGYVENIRPNVRLCHNTVITIDEVDFILTPLWSHIRQEDVFVCERGVSDFHLIQYDGERFSANNFNYEHHKALEFLRNAVSSSTRKKVVVTHHVPTQLCNSPEFKGSRINGVFVVELHDYIYDSNIDFWVYGHTHRNMPEVNINGTKLICNQLGYVDGGEEGSFNRQTFFKI